MYENLKETSTLVLHQDPKIDTSQEIHEITKYVMTRILTLVCLKQAYPD